MKSIKLVLLLLFACSFCFAQDLIFAKQIKYKGNTGNSLNIIGSVISNDNFYLAGTFKDTVIIDTVIKHSTSNPNWNGNTSFIAKYNQTGELDKILNNTGTGIFSIEHINTDQIGNIYLTAYALGNIVLDTSIISTSIDSSCYIIIKLDSNLNVIWKKSIYNNSSASSGIRIDNITINKNNDLIIVSTAFGNFNLDGIQIIGNNKPFLAKINSSNGIAQWVNQIYGNFTCIADNMKITTDENNDILLSGRFYSTVNSNQDFLVFNFTDTVKLVNFYTSATFLSKIQDNGNYMWAKRIDTIYPSIPANISTDTNNNIFLGGNKLYKYNSIGNLIWTKDISNGEFKDIVHNGISNYSVMVFNDSIEYDNVKIYSEGNKEILFKTNSNSGNLEWHSKPYNLGLFGNLYTNKKGISSLTGITYNSLFEKNLFYDNEKSIGYMICFNDSSYYSSNSNLIKGKIYNDVNSNCSLDADIMISGIGVIVYPGPYYSVTDSFGNFEVKVNSGIYQVEQLKTIGHAIDITPTCGINPNSVYFSGIAQIDSSSNFPNLYNECSILKSYIYRPIMTTPCIDNGETHITIINLGIDTIFNVIAKVKYPGYSISPLYSIPMFSSYSVIDSLVTFSIPYIAPNTSFYSVIHDTIDCSSVTLSSQYLFNLKVEPINICYLEDSIYNYDTYTSTLILPVGVIKTDDSIDKIIIYPNPTHSTLNFLAKNQNIYQISIFNYLGQLIKLIKAENSSTIKSIDCSDLATGLYTIQIKEMNGVISNYKFIKQ